jgi:hypothetical protein
MKTKTVEINQEQASLIVDALRMLRYEKIQECLKSGDIGSYSLCRFKEVEPIEKLMGFFLYSGLDDDDATEKMKE